MVCVCVSECVSEGGSVSYMFGSVWEYLSVNPKVNCYSFTSLTLPIIPYKMIQTDKAEQIKKPIWQLAYIWAH